MGRAVVQTRLLGGCRLGGHLLDHGGTRGIEGRWVAEVAHFAFGLDDVHARTKLPRHLQIWGEPHAGLGPVLGLSGRPLDEEPGPYWEVGVGAVVHAGSRGRLGEGHLPDDASLRCPEGELVEAPPLGFTDGFDLVDVAHVPARSGEHPCRVEVGGEVDVAVTSGLGLLASGHEDGADREVHGGSVVVGAAHREVSLDRVW